MTARRPHALTLYAAAGVLVLFELYVLARAMRPNVSAAYRAYYIDRTSDCWPRPLPLVELPIGRKIAFNDKPGEGEGSAFRRCGWGSPENWGTWTLGPSSELAMRIAPVGKDLVLRAQVMGFAGARAAQEVRVVVDGQPQARWMAQSFTPGEVTATIPQGATQDGELRITFEIAYPTSPAEFGMGRDARKLGMGLLWLSVSEADR